MGWNLIFSIVGLVCISLVATDVEHCFIGFICSFGEMFAQVICLFYFISFSRQDFSV